MFARSKRICKGKIAKKHGRRHALTIRTLLLLGISKEYSNSSYYRQQAHGGSEFYCLSISKKR